MTKIPSQRRVKVKRVRAWAVVNRFGPVLTNLQTEQMAVYTKKDNARKDVKPFKWEDVQKVTITYSLPRPSKKKPKQHSE